MKHDLKQILKDNNLTLKDFASELRMTYGSCRAALSSGTPRWLRSFMLGYKLGKK